jgi:tetratricopeptide (TPR) repeat protein
MSRAVRFDYAAFQAEQGEPLEALKILHQLVGENSDDLSAWQAGGQIALSSPDFIEFACDWTGEAVKHFPENLSLLRQRAEALLCSGNAMEALPLWQKLSSAQNPLSLAPLVICEVVNDMTGRTLPSAEEPAVSQEFLKWYRRLLGAENTKLIHELNGRLKSLERILPSAATILEAAVLDAKETPVA